MPRQRRRPRYVHPEPGPHHDAESAVRRRRPRRHSDLRRLFRPALLRLADRQSRRPQPLAPTSHRPHATGAGIDGRRRRQDDNPAPPEDTQRPGFRRREFFYAVYGPVFEIGGTQVMKKYLIIVEATSAGFSAYSPDIGGCVSTGQTREE